MNNLIISADKVTLPAALLPSFKRYQRIDFDEDDELIKELLQEAIELFERNTEITVFASEFILEPELSDWNDNDLRLPVTPINSLTITSPGALEGQLPHSDETLLDDLSGYLGGVIVGDFVLRAKGFHGVRIFHLIGTPVDGMTITVLTGYTFASLPPEIRGVLMKMAGQLYEYREIYTPSALHEPEAWWNDMLAGFWLPRV